MIFPLLATLLCLAVCRYYWRIWKYPKGPFPLPFLGNALQVTPNKLHIQLEKWRKIYGDIFTLWILNTPMVFLLNYKLIKEALQEKGELFVDRSGMFAEDILQFVPNGGVVFASGENWREQRRVSVQIFKEFGVGKNILEEMIHLELEKFIDEIKKRAETGNVDFRWPIQILVANVINNILYGFSYDYKKSERLMKYADNVNLLLKEVAQSPLAYVAQVFPFIRKIPYIGYWSHGIHKKRYEQCIQMVKADVTNALSEYSIEEEPTCFVQSYFKRMTSNSSLSIDQLYNVCADFFLAGMETTSTTLQWTVLHIAANVEEQKKIREEIFRVVGRERFPSMRDRTSMPYARCFLAELQRIANIIPITIMHKNSQDVPIGGLIIPAGSIVVPQVYSVLYNEELFSDPKKFIPERFLLPNRIINPILLDKMIAFGMGRRQCAGETLAQTELFLIVCAIVQRFEILPPTEAPVDLEPVAGTVLSPKPTHLKIRLLSDSF